jgi:uncharacterized coiled-coil DUF342 family protein
MTDLITEIKQKRDTSNRQAIVARDKRDRLNEKIRTIIGKRDKFNKEVRKHINTAKEHMKRRDEFNTQVQGAKAKRDALHVDIGGLQDGLDSLKRQNAPRVGPSLHTLRKELRELEFNLMTHAFSTKREKEIIGQAKEKQQQIVEREKLVETPEIQEKSDALTEKKTQAKELHDVVQENASLAQAEHELMIQNFDKSSELKKLADAQQKEMMSVKEIADEQHRQCVDFTRKVHDFDKIVSGLIQKRRLESRSKEEMSTKMEAVDIFQKFKKGEKLSTSDLMSLQKAGLI